MKNLKNLGETLNKEEQQSINGGGGLCSYRPKRCENRCCPKGYCCGSDPYNCVPSSEGCR